MFFVGAFTQGYIHSKLGFVRLLGIGHIFWIPLVIWLGLRLDSAGLNDAFGFWLASVLALNSVSLVIDATDVTRFILGERSPIY